MPSLIAAINAANASGVDSTIALAPGCTYTLSAVDNQTKGPNGLPVIRGTLAIAGQGAVIERNNGPATPPFRLFLVDKRGQLDLQNLTVRNGQLPAGPDGRNVISPGAPSPCVGGTGANGAASSTAAG